MIKQIGQFERQLEFIDKTQVVEGIPHFQIRHHIVIDLFIVFGIPIPAAHVADHGNQFKIPQDVYQPGFQGPFRGIDHLFVFGIPDNPLKCQVVIVCQYRIRGVQKEVQVLIDEKTGFNFHSLDNRTSDTATKLLKTYRLSHGLLIADALIAATAIVNGIQLISKNQKDYRFIEQLELLEYPSSIL
uniref:PIN domain-containing protein n=1 Tax=Desulfotignum balticum TaxID=115781 RepID=B2DD69_9BACT|nr:hypothetical protein [Desulfotignum balticum]